MNEVKLLLISILFLKATIMSGQDQKTDTLVRHEKIKKGWNVAALPALGYDSDLGLNYGIISNVYDYGKIYPKYRHSFFLEISRNSKGSWKNTISYDSEFLIPKTRITIQGCRFIEQASDFFGFNGYKAYYNPDLETKGNPEYISRMYYRYQRVQTFVDLTLQGSIVDNKLRWLGGCTFFNTKIGSVNIHKLNRGRRNKDQLPDTFLLYDNYVKWGIIPQNQKRGGESRVAKLGVVYDTRDNEPNPMRGIWTEAMIVAAPSFFGNKNSFAKLIVTHRQYFTLKKDILNLAYRISYQGRIGGEVPFYMLPEVYNSDDIREGLGGSRTLRGVLRNRVIGESFVYGNLELRCKCLWLTLFNQNFYFAVDGFTDFGRIVEKYKFTTDNPDAINYLSKGSPETWHQTYGLGLYGAMNQNFVGGITYGIAANPKDGKNGLYVVIDFLF